MRQIKDLKCNRCGCSASLQGIDGEALGPDIARDLHTCPDGQTSDSFSLTSRNVPGPGERLSDKERN